MVLLRLFAWLDRVLGAATAPAPGPGPTTAGPTTGTAAGIVSTDRPGVPEPRARPAREPLGNAALLSVDGAGQYLLCAGERLTLGHLRAARADLGFLADVGAVHAELVRVDSLQDGPGWRIVPCGAERVRVEGRDVPLAGRRMAAGERVRLGENLEFRLQQPDPASASVLLELLHGIECAGARRIVLLAPGAGGRLRIGAALSHHVRVAGLAFDLALEWHGSELRVSPSEPLEGVPPHLAFPPAERVALRIGAPHGSRPPFGLSLEPVERFVPGRGSP
jgi:hypothetical protein